MKMNWKLDCPTPDCGKIVDGVYRVGAMLADDRESNTSEDARMQTITGVTEADFEAYVRMLENAGFSDCYAHSMGADKFFAGSYAAKNYHVRYLAARNELRVIEDRNVTPLTRFGYEAAGEKQTVIYQYGLYYDPNNDCTDKTVNCGMLYVIRLCDNRLMLIDGGHLYQWNAQALQAFWSFLHQITDTPEDGVIDIACWYFTHAHGDHVMGCTRLLDRYHEQIKLERVMHGFVSYQVDACGYDPSVFAMKRAIRQYYPDVPCLRLHAGQKFPLADVICEVLYAQEDAVEANAPEKFPLLDFNCTSTIIKLTVNGKTALFLGDTNLESEKLLAKISTPDIWKADAVQVAHHCFNFLDTLYAWADAPMAWLPNSYFGAHTPENTPKLESVLRFVGDGQIYYEGEATYGFAAGKCGFMPIFTESVVGGAYDGSGD